MQNYKINRNVQIFYLDLTLGVRAAPAIMGQVGVRAALAIMGRVRRVGQVGLVGLVGLVGQVGLVGLVGGFLYCSYSVPVSEVRGWRGGFFSDF